MQRIIKYALTALIAASAQYTLAQSESSRDLTKEGLIADFRLAVEILKEQHPHPYKFVDSVTLDRQVDSLLQRAASAGDAFACLQYSPIQLFRDVHTKLRLSADNSQKVFKEIRFFPFPILIERDKLFVNMKGGAVSYAAEIVSINRQPAKEVIRSLASASYSDGYITTGTDRVYGNFQVTLSLQHADREAYTLEYIAPGGKDVQKITLPSSTPTEGVHAARMAVLPFNRLQLSYNVFGEFDDEIKTGILTVKSFNLQEAYAYKEFSEFFKEVNKRGYKQVIIDIRSNGGGNPAISALLYSFIAPGSFDNVYNQRTRTIDIAYPEYAVTGGRTMSEADITQLENFLHQRFNLDSASGFYVGNARLKESQLENYPPDKDAFAGDVYVLTGGGTVSAATYFASLVQKNKRGTIVGKETGSGEQSTTAAWFLNYRLPNTKSILRVPMSEMYFFNATTDNGRGVIPDQEVPLDKFVSYIRASQDPELSYTMELIHTKK